MFMTIIVGAVIGWLASTRMRTEGQMGIAAVVIAGIVGAFLGDFVAGALGLGGGVIVGGLIAVAGAYGLITVLDRTGVFEKLAA